MFMETQCRNRDNQSNSSFSGQCFNYNKYGHKSVECRSMVNRRNVSCYSCGKFGHIANQWRFKGNQSNLGLIRETTPFVMLATNLVILQNIVEARIWKRMLCQTRTKKIIREKWRLKKSKSNTRRCG